MQHEISPWSQLLLTEIVFITTTGICLAVLLADTPVALLLFFSDKDAAQGVFFFSFYTAHDVAMVTTIVYLSSRNSKQLLTFIE